MRRIIQTIALLVLILTGSLPGLRLAGAPISPCCAAMAGSGCPCRAPGRAPATPGPCAGAAQGLPLAAPGWNLQAAAKASLREPSPIPRFLLAQAAPRTLASGPESRPRPGPAPPDPSQPTQADLSVFRI